MPVGQTTTRAFGSPLRYIQGPNECDNLPQHTALLGSKVLILIDKMLFSALSFRFGQLYAAGQAAELMAFGGECTYAEVERVKQMAQKTSCDVLVGVGGGKTLDTIKMAANDLALPYVIAPSSASTDAPTSAMSVIYKETGEHLRSVCHARGASLVLVDTTIIAKAPLRLFVAGMGDALSTWYEANANQQSDTPNYIGQGYRRCQAGMAIAERCAHILMQQGKLAYTALAQGACTEAVENVIEANILLSGLGFENTGCAGAHAIHTGFSEIPSTHQCYHGEVVAFGVLFQLMLENAPREELRKVLEFNVSVGLPITLEELHVAPSEENLKIIAGRILDGNSGVDAEPFLVTQQAVHQAILGADALGKQYKETGGI